MNITGKIISILGAGGSGRAAARLAVAQGAIVHIYDSGEILNTDGIPASVKLHPLTTNSIAEEVESDLVVTSPGIDTYGDVVKAFSQNAGELIGEVEFATRFYNGKIIAITGTNGKTTTTELVQTLCTAAGVSCVACGNYGVAVSDVVNAEDIPEVLALEVSSFQLETIKHFCPDVSIWLNFDADHMDRYQSLSDYKNAKLRIFENQSSEHTAIVKLGEEIKTSAKTLYFSSEESADYSLFGSEIQCDGKSLFDIAKTKLRGLHNAENIMAATAALSALGIESSESALVKFTPPRHRCELVAEVAGVEFINDSKATNLHALDSALRSLPSPIILIAGGKDKGLNYTELNKRLKTTVKKAFVIGEISEQLLQQFPSEIHPQQCATLEEAVNCAASVAKAGDTVLFSPGTSSFDMFKGYEDRGDAFVNAIKKSNQPK